MEPEIAALYTEAVFHTAAARFGFRPESAEMLDGFENFIYVYPRGEREYILRLSHSSKKPVEAIRSELAWVNHLAAHGVSVSQAIPSESGSLTEPIPAADGTTFTAVAFEKAPGSHPHPADHTPEFYERWGRLLGQIHAISRDYHPTDPALQRIHWDQEVEVTQPEAYLPAGHGLFLERYQEVIDQLRALPVDAQHYGIIHNDAHPYNLLVEGERITLIDWEDCVQMWFASELAICLTMLTIWPPGGVSREDYTRQFWPPFVRGYRQANELDDQWMATIPLFVTFRLFGQYVALYRGVDWDDPNPWALRFFEGRKERLEGRVPYLDLDITKLA